MRVLESIGSGAVLITDDLAGTEMVVPREHYLVIEDDVVAQVNGLLANPAAMQKLTRDALEHALGHHTYDHCVDDLVEVVQSIEPAVATATAVSLSPMAELIDQDVEVQRFAQFGLPDLVTELLSREIWDGDLRIERLKAGSVEAVAIGPGGTRHLNRALQAARRYIYAAGDIDAIASYVRRELPDANSTRHGDLLRVDLNADSYRIMPHERSITT
jgi:hypothetical protein